MTETHDVRLMLDAAELYTHEGEAPTPEDFELDAIDTAMDALKVWRAADRQLQAAKRVREAAGVRLAQLLGDGGAAAIGDNIVRYRVSKAWKCVDPEGWNAFVGNRIMNEELEPLEIVNPDYAKRTWMGDAVRDTFYELVEDDHPSLTIVPRDRAPKFLQDLGDGEVLVRRKEE